MENRQVTVPWTSEEDWSQLVFSIRLTISAMANDLAPLHDLAGQIISSYRDIDTVLERTCRITCPSCAEVCCTKATVWYDLKDLLLIYFNTGSFPKRQIYRKPDRCCCNLTPFGCRLRRSERPFICTWYVCPEQKTVLKELSVTGHAARKADFFSSIEKIKTTRKALESLYIATAASQQRIQF